MNQETSKQYKKVNLIKLQPISKIILSALIAFFWLTATSGQPPNRQLLKGINHIDTTYEQVFQTTIAIEKKRFTKRIIESSEGYWSLIPYVNQAKWMDLQIILTTRIGFDAEHASVSKGQNGKIKVDFYSPTILSKTCSTQIIDKSQTIFNKWDIQEYKTVESQIMEAIADEESQILLQQFRNDPDKMKDLTRRLDNKLQITKSWMYKPMEFIDTINAFMNRKIMDFITNLVEKQKPQIFDRKKYKKISGNNVSIQQNPTKIVKKQKQKKLTIPDHQIQMRKKYKNKLQL